MKTINEWLNADCGLINGSFIAEDGENYTNRDMVGSVLVAVGLIFLTAVW